MDIKKAMIRARNKADGEKESPEMEVPENNEIANNRQENAKPVEVEDLLKQEIDAVEQYWQYLQGNISKKEKLIFEEILKDEESHLEKIKSLMGLRGKELVMMHDKEMEEIKHGDSGDNEVDEK